MYSYILYEQGLEGPLWKLLTHGSEETEAMTTRTGLPANHQALSDQQKAEKDQDHLTSFSFQHPCSISHDSSFEHLKALAIVTARNLILYTVIDVVYYLQGIKHGNEKCTINYINMQI